MTEMTGIKALLKQLKALGLRDGDTVMTHASMRSLGPIEGGAAGLIEALLAAVGAQGTLIMLLGAAEGEPFDAERTPVDTKDMGILAEVFRTFPGVQVSDHPADRLGAIGRQSRYLLKSIPLHDYHGPGSPLERFCRIGGRVLRLGASPDTVTLTHYAEYLADLPRKNRVRRRYERADSGEVWIESLDDNDGIAVWPKGNYFEQIYRDYTALGTVRAGLVGRCNAELFDAQDFVPFAVGWMNRELAAFDANKLK
jgi:aminoglycoside N3'-acetyltransferase